MGSPVPLSVSFLVLALNEEEGIEATVATIRRSVAASRLEDHEIIMVNDGSTDRTGEIMDRLAATLPKCKAVHNPRNLNLGGAYKAGIKVATCEYVMIMAGDDITPESDMLRILDCIGKADMVLPHLTNPKLRPITRRIPSKGFTFVINTLFGLHLRYYQGVLPRKVLLDKIEIKTDSYAFTAEIVVKLIRCGCSYIEVGLPDTPSKTGKSLAMQPKRVVAVLKAIYGLVREVRRSESSRVAAEIKALSIGRQD